MKTMMAAMAMRAESRPPLIDGTTEKFGTFKNTANAAVAAVSLTRMKTTRRRRRSKATLVSGI